MIKEKLIVSKPREIGRLPLNLSITFPALKARNKGISEKLAAISPISMALAFKSNASSGTMGRIPCTIAWCRTPHRKIK
ncbi:hypothetical protein GCM10008935_26630 [Alkalibacillus silvisoli]|uniref:Uncharacterized protein n=1 Tax=Alkalibacillus silvisoli TaxID=392823 RepID=A0ABN1A7H3_9BACI